MPLGVRSACFIEVPENRAALAAVEAVIHNDDSQAPLLLLHGPTGVGKSRLVRLAIDGLQALAPETTIFSWNAADLAPGEAAQWLEPSRQADVLIVEDLQHLGLSFVEAVIDVLDDRDARGLQTLVTADAGPKDLAHRDVLFPARLRSRLAAGCVVALEPLTAPSRQRVLDELTQQLAIDPEAVALLAQRLRTWREIEGAVTFLQTMAQERAIEVADLKAYLGEADCGDCIDRIAQRVSDYFGLTCRKLKSPIRARKILLARQVGMYLARRLTNLPLQGIGRYFGGRDHSTVLHACAKIEQLLAVPSHLAGDIRRLEGELA